MIDNELKMQIERVAQETDWSVRFDEHNGETNIEFESYTDRGQDLIVNIWVADDANIGDVACELYRYWESYDPDEEASLWIGEDGHGKNGAPYRLSDLLDDMKNAEQMIEDLHDALSEVA